jgi:hypothetical protein
LQRKPAKKSPAAAKSSMSVAERRRVLEGIARDDEAYPRDRIAAIKALEELDRGISDRPAEGFDSLDELTPRRQRA